MGELEVFQGVVTELFKKSSALPSYTRLTIYNSYDKASNVVFDSQASWLQEIVSKSGLVKQEILTYEDIHALLKKIKSTQWKNLWKSGAKLSDDQVLYFDQPEHFADRKDIALTLAAASLFQNYTRFEFRPIHLKNKNGRRFFGLALKAHFHGKNEIFYFDSSIENESLHMRNLNGILLGNEWSLCSQSSFAKPVSTVWTQQEKTFQVIGEKGQELIFQVAGRTPSEKRFEKEESLLSTATQDQLVPIEICYHPFWRPLGHTTLRVGKSLFELSANGWRAHTQGSNTARAFIFNNPFFRKQLALFGNQGMPPMSLGVTFMVEKAKVDRLLVTLENLTAANGPQAEKFSLISNNCNQGILRVLTQSGIAGFDFKGYQEFSTVLTFRSLLLNCQHPIEGLRFYPLPNSEFDEKTARKWIPTLLYRYNDSSRELKRALPVFPRDFIYINYKRVVGYVRGQDAQNA